MTTDALMDTHTLLWLTDDDPRLSVGAKEAIFNEDVKLFVSVISIWEIAIKIGNQKLDVGSPLSDYLVKVKEKYEIEVLPLDVDPVLLVSSLPFPHSNHKDPYDRVLISQCLVLSIPMISIDEKFDAYGVQRIW